MPKTRQDPHRVAVFTLRAQTHDQHLSALCQEDATREEQGLGEAVPDPRPWSAMVHHGSPNQFHPRDPIAFASPL